MRSKLIVGNWKMNGDLRANDRLLAALRNRPVGGSDRNVAVCVPFTYLAQARDSLQGSAIAWGAQNVSEHRSGAFTGEVSAAMVAEFGCRYTLVGHSERRALFGDTDAVVAAKAVAALDAGLVPIVCVGEVLAERDAGATEAVVLRQLGAVVSELGERTNSIVVAYEPVWAIGTGRTATPEQAQSVHAALRKYLAASGSGAGEVKLLYGGSVKGDNAKGLFACADIDGGLIGGASLKADEFLAIAAA